MSIVLQDRSLFGIALFRSAGDAVLCLARAVITRFETVGPSEVPEIGESNRQ